LCLGLKKAMTTQNAPAPLSRAHELARRLRQAVYDVIDPPLPMLEAIAVEIPADASGFGVVVLRVPPSRRKPHRLQSNREVYIRREDESVKIGMRQIQELTIQSVAEASRVDSTLSERGVKFRTALYSWLKEKHSGAANVAGGSLDMIAVPTTALDLGRVVGRPELTEFQARAVATFGANEYLCHFPMGRPGQWRPGLRLVRAEYETDNRKSVQQLETNGICEFSFFFITNDRSPGIFTEWLIGALAHMFCWIEKIRASAGDVAGEFALAVQMPIYGRELVLVEYGTPNFSMSHGNTLPVGFHQFPTMSVGGTEEFPQHLQRFDEDIWNLAGHDVQRNAPTFKITC
jgi:hypothetical protein